MAATTEHASVPTASPGSLHRQGRLACLVVTALSIVAAAIGAVDGWHGDPAGRVVWAGLTVAWAIAAATLLWRLAEDRLGVLAVWFCALASLTALVTGMADSTDGDAVVLARALAVSLLLAAAMHVLIAVPNGTLATRTRSFAVGAAYLAATGVAVLLWVTDASLPSWLLVVEAVLALGIGVAFVNSRYRLARGPERHRMQWIGAALTVIVEVTLVVFALKVLVGWSTYTLEVAGLATISLPLALALGASRRLNRWIERIFVRAISLVGLTALVLAVYVVVVLGLGRAPNDEQRTLLLLSMLAAGVAALLYVPARERLATFANELVHGARQTPQELVRSFGARLSRDVPLEELLLQLVESLHTTLALAAAEVWTGSGGRLDRVVSEPDRGPASVQLTEPEEVAVARGGVAGPAWAAVWLPKLLTDGGDAVVRVAPITNAGELFGLIVVERAGEDATFDDDEESVLQELARRVGLALRNVQLDSELQASLEELRQQAEELRASRARVVAAGDAERRRIERDLHDGAQQYLVGLAVHIRLARELADSDPEKAKGILDELSAFVQEAQQALRDLAHGIYPPLLQDRGLDAALAAAAGRTSIPARVETSGVGRYEGDVEATVYFCCLEALQNAAKYAGEGARARIRVWQAEGDLRFAVTDDGAGFGLSRIERGSGLTNMRDRLGAMGGSLRVESEPGRGTTVCGAIPIER